MPQDRRTTDRRRRILYSSQTADTTKPTAASRRAKEKLREARQPTKTYGRRVHRRIRGRWFSLVPVKRRTLVIFAAVIAACVYLLTHAHYAAVTWPSLVYKPEIARPLRLDLPDSFGRWFTSAILVASAGASLLIYQLRRHRNDDYRGHYRLWRLVILVMLLTSVNSLVMMVDWGGSLLDMAFGRRVAFSGYDWLRILLGVGGVVLALRLVFEVRRSRWALTALVSACFFLALPEAAKWRLFAVDVTNRWLVTSAPLLGYTSLFLALTGYLSLLYREVLGITDEETLGQRFNRIMTGWFSSNETDAEDDRQKKPKRSRKRAVAVHETVAEEPEYAEDEEEYAEEDEEQVYAEDDEEQLETEEPAAATDDTDAPRKKRRWFGLRAAKPDAEDESDDSSRTTETKTKKKRRFGLRLDPNEANSNEAEPSEEEVEATADEEDASPKKKRRFGLSWRKKKQEVAEDVQDETESYASDAEEDTEEQEQYEAHEDASDNEEIDENEIDWNSMSKSERRRLRKKLKRQRRAA